MTAAALEVAARDVAHCLQFALGMRSDDNVFRHLGVLVAAVVASGVFAPVAAHAGGERFDGRSLALEAQAGRAMPLGFYGLAVDASLSRHFAISGGVGFGYEGAHGATTQFMLASRLRIPFGAGWAVSAGAGVSMGDYIQTAASPSEVSEQRWEPAVRVNGELSLEYRFAGPLSARLFGGIGRIVNQPQCLYIAGGATYEGPCRSPEVPERSLTYDRTPTFFGVALAYQLAGDTRLAPSNPVLPLSGEGPRWQRWYGWQTLAADAVGWGLLYAAYQQKPKSEWAYATQGAGGAIYVAGGPTVHLAHHSPLRSLLSLLTRVALPLAGSLLFYATTKDPYECSGLDCNFVRGGYVGAVGASIVDAAFLSYR